MSIQELIKIVEKEIEDKEKNIEVKKTNINSDYTLAKLDFITIDNMQDSLETYKVILLKLNNLQQRVIDRNKGRKVC